MRAVKGWSFVCIENEKSIKRKRRRDENRRREGERARKRKNWEGKFMLCKNNNIERGEKDKKMRKVGKGRLRNEKKKVGNKENWLTRRLKRRGRKLEEKEETGKRKMGKGRKQENNAKTEKRKNEKERKSRKKRKLRNKE